MTAARLGRVKAWFLSGSVALGSALGLWALWQASGGEHVWPWVWAAVATLATPLRVLTYFLVDQRTTPGRMPGLLGVTTASVGLAAFSVLREGAPAALAVAIGGAVMTVAYVFWYSHLQRTRSGRIARGEVMPSVELVDADGRVVRTDALASSRVLYMFYRGNWCPLCMAQIREVAGLYRELDKRGVRVALVSPQPQEKSASLARRFDVPMLFLTDRGGAAARALGILHEGGLPATFDVLGYDQDTVLPTVILAEKGGQILYVDETDNYRVRPEPQTFLTVLDEVDARAASVARES